MMKNTKFSFIASVIFLVLYTAGVSYAALEGTGSGLVGWWKFDEGSGTAVNDSSGNGNSGTFVGAPKWTTGPTGGAVLLDGFKDYIRIPYYPSLMLSKRTIVVWVNSYDNLKHHNSIVSFGRDDPVTPACYDTNHSSFSYLGVNMSYQRTEGSGDMITRSMVAPYGIWKLGKWDHYAFVFDSTGGTNVTRSVYKNGVLVGSPTVTTDGLSDDCGMYAIGTQEDYPNPNYVRTFSGAIGEVRVYNRALSPEEIEELYDRVIPSSDTAIPTIPTGFSATAVSSSQIDLSWNASTDDVGVAGYVIYRGGLPMATVMSVTRYSDTSHAPTSSMYRYTVAPSTSYTYTVAAFDAAGNYSAQSTTASATTPAEVSSGPYTLSVIRTGTSLGGVAITPAGGSTTYLSTGTTYSGSYGGGTSIVLGPYGYTYSGTRYFNGWSGGGCVGNGECQIIMNSDKAVTAYYGTAYPPTNIIPLYGDVSGDGRVSAYDGALAVQYAVGLITLTPEQITRADVSGGGGVSAYDAALIAQKAVGLIDKFPVEG